MKIVSWNVNGLLACMGKGGFIPIAGMQPDIVCCQEVKTHQQPEVLPGYFHYWQASQRKGYAGVLTMSLREPLSVRRGLDIPRLDVEGRLLTLEFPAFSLLNAYFPNSQDGPHRRAYRSAWDAAFFDFVQKLGQEKTVLICGDFNVTRSAIDIFPGNTRLMWAEAGYMSEERAALEKLLGSGFVDGYRWFHPGQSGAYTWWSHRFNKRSKDDGWRLDYFLIPREAVKKITAVTHHTDLLGSDHCPIGLDIHMAHVYINEASLLKDFNKLTQENQDKAGRYIKNLLRVQRAETKLCGQVSHVEWKEHELARSATEDKIRCSFCGKPQSVAERIIAGSDVYICDDCVKLCAEIVEEEEKKEQAALAKS